MVATSLTVTTTCGGNAVSCCNGNNSESWAKLGGRVTAGVKGLQQRCSAATAGKAAAGAAWASVNLSSRSSHSPRAVARRRGGSEVLLLRRVQSFANDQPYTTTTIVATPAIAAPAVAVPGLWRASAAASLDGFEGNTTVRAREAGNELEKNRVERTTDVLKCGTALHHHPLLTESTPMWCRSSNSNTLQQTIVMGTSCPDFMLFFPRSSPPVMNVDNTKENSSNETKTFFAVVPTNGFDSSTCGSACFSTDDEKGNGNSSREDRDVSVSCSPTPAKRTAVEVGEACFDRSANNMKEALALRVTASSPFDEHPEGGENEPSIEPTPPSAHEKNYSAVSNSSSSAVTLATVRPSSTTATALINATLQPVGCIGYTAEEGGLEGAEEKQIRVRLSAVADNSEISDLVEPTSHAVGKDITEASGCSAPVAIVLGITTKTLAAAGVTAGESAATDSGPTTAEDELGTREAPIVATLTGRTEKVVQMEVEVNISTSSGTQQAAEVLVSEKLGCEAALGTRVRKKVNARVLFPSPQAPSLPQLLQLADVFEAAILALRVLPERYTQRIEQLDALEALFPGVYVHCSYMARVRQVYVFSRDLIQSHRETLMQQLLEERDRRRLRSSKAPKQLPLEQRFQEKTTAVEEIVFEEDEEDNGTSWTPDGEHNKALHAVAGLLMEIKAVQTRVGPTLLAGAAQLADVLHLSEQEVKGEEGKGGLNGERSSNQDCTSDGNCVYRNIRVEYDRVNDVVHSSYYSTEVCSSVDPAGLEKANLNGVDDRSFESEMRSSSERDGCECSTCEVSKRGEDMNSVSERDSDCSGRAGTFYIGHYCRGVQMLVDNFLHSFFSCRVASELQREHFLLAVQSGDCGAIISSCVPMEQLIFQAALDVQELALHHLGIAAPVEVWVGEAGQADQQLRAFLLAASIREGPTTVAWSACSSPTTPCRPYREEGANCSQTNCEVVATTVNKDNMSAAPASGWHPVASEKGCLDTHHEEQKRQPQRPLGLNCAGSGGDRGEGRKDEESNCAADEAAGEPGGRSSSCRNCLSSSFAAAVASPRWRAQPGRDYQSNPFSRNSSRSRSNSVLPGTVRFPCFASYAYSGIFELLKNSMRASIEAWRLNRFTRSNGADNCSSNNCTSSNTSDPNTLRSNTHNNDNGIEEQQRWRLLTVKRSRKLKKLPGRVRLQRRRSDAAAATRFRVTMACSKDLAAAADQERTAGSNNEEKALSLGQNSMLDQGQSSHAKDEDYCCEVVQLEDGVLPPIKVLLLFVDDSLVIRVEDQGEGLRRSELQNVWSFAYTTASGKGLLQRLAAAGEESEDAGNRSTAADPRGRRRSSAATAVPPLAGCGVGLPMGRVHAQSLGGDIFLESAEG